MVEAALLLRDAGACGNCGRRHHGIGRWTAWRRLRRKLLTAGALQESDFHLGGVGVLEFVAMR